MGAIEGVELTCAWDGTGVDLTVVSPAGAQCTAALLQGHAAGQHVVTQVLIVQVVVTLLSLHRRGWEGRREENIANKSERLFKDQFYGDSTPHSIVNAPLQVVQHCGQ